jgi:hypothetical protein
MTSPTITVHRARYGHWIAEQVPIAAVRFAQAGLGNGNGPRPTALRFKRGTYWRVRERGPRTTRASDRQHDSQERRPGLPAPVPLPWQVCRLPVSTPTS